MSYQEDLKAYIVQLQTELRQTHDKLRQEIDRSKQLEVKCNALKEQLIQERRLLSQIINNSPNLIFVHDIDGRFILVNQAVAQIYNTSTEELIGKTDDIFHCRINQHQIEYLNHPSVSVTQECLILPNGERRHFQVTRFQTKFDNDNSITLCIYVDITASKLPEDKIEACNRDETKLKEMIQNFITITSHEFRTPLTTILGSAELLGYYGKDWDEERIIFHINRIQSSVQHMVRMLDNFLFLENNI